MKKRLAFHALSKRAQYERVRQSWTTMIRRNNDRFYEGGFRPRVVVVVVISPWGGGEGGRV